MSEEREISYDAYVRSLAERAHEMLINNPGVLSETSAVWEVCDTAACQWADAVWVIENTSADDIDMGMVDGFDPKTIVYSVAALAIREDVAAEFANIQEEREEDEDG